MTTTFHGLCLFLSHNRGICTQSSIGISELVPNFSNFRTFPLPPLGARPQHIQPVSVQTKEASGAFAVVCAGGIGGCRILPASHAAPLPCRSGGSPCHTPISRFLEFVMEGRVREVRFTPDRMSLDALLTTTDAPDAPLKLVRVHTPPTDAAELLRRLTEHGVAISVARPGFAGGLLGLAANLAFPLIFLGTLLLMARRGSRGMPDFGLGSKARFEMEPNTGVTFADVAGVDEAKQDLMEVPSLSPMSSPPPPLPHVVPCQGVYWWW